MKITRRGGVPSGAAAFIIKGQKDSVEIITPFFSTLF
jgi:hypothetical protein